MLLYAQDEIGSVTPELVEEVARRTGITPLQVDEVVTYYSMLHQQAARQAPHPGLHQHKLHARGRRRNCGSTPARSSGIGHKEVTADGQFSLEEVECIGACSWAPAIQVNYEFHHQMTPEKLDQLIESLRKLQ